MTDKELATTQPTWEGVKSQTFDDSPLAQAYYMVKNELQERDPVGKSRPWHAKVALWAAWSTYKDHLTGTVITDENGKKRAESFIELLGLPRTQREMAKLLNVSPRTLRSYRHKYGHYAESAKYYALDQILERYTPQVIHALGMSASDPSYQSASDRRTFLSVVGMLDGAGNRTSAPSDEDAGKTVDDWKKEWQVAKAERDAITSDTLDIFEGGDG